MRLLCGWAFLAWRAVLGGLPTASLPSKLPLHTCAEPGGFKVKAAARQGGGRRKKAAAAPAEGEEGADDADADRAAASPAAGEQGQDDSPAGGSAGKAGEDGEQDGPLTERRVGRPGDPLEDVSAGIFFREVWLAAPDAGCWRGGAALTPPSAATEAATGASAGSPAR